MSQQQAPSKEQLITWLEQQPEVLLEAPQLLQQLTLSHQTSGATSLLERQNQQLRQQVEHYQTRLHELVAVAKDNDRLFAQTRQLVLHLVEATHLEELAQHLQTQLNNEFGALTSTLLLFHQHPLPQGAYRQTSLADLSQDLQMLIGRQRITCGSFRPHESQELFGEQMAEQVASAVLVPLHFEHGLGVLAIGSDDPMHFRSSLDTLFIEYIGAILSRRLHQLLPMANTQPQIQQVAQ